MRVSETSERPSQPNKQKLVRIWSLLSHRLVVNHVLDTRQMLVNVLIRFLHCDTENKRALDKA